VRNILDCIKMMMAVLVLTISSQAALAQSPQPELSEDYDWIQLNSNEWLKGEVIAMYDDTLEFDSDVLGVLNIDFGDIERIVVRSDQTLRLTDGRVVRGSVEYSNGTLTLDDNGKVEKLAQDDILSLSPARDSELSNWDGKISIGWDSRDGNTIQENRTVNAKLRRRTASNRFEATYLSNYSESTDTDTDVTTKTADSVRVNAFFDHYLSRRWFVRIPEYEYFKDEFQNIDARHTYGVKLGYTAVDTSSVMLEFAAGPSYQTTTFTAVQQGESREEESSVISLSSRFEWEIVNNLDYHLYYHYDDVNEESGDGLHHIETGFETEPLNNFTAALTYYIDRTEAPQPLADGTLPKDEDTRLVLSLGYKF